MLAYENQGGELIKEATLFLTLTDVKSSRKKKYLMEGIIQFTIQQMINSKALVLELHATLMGKDTLRNIKIY